MKAKNVMNSGQRGKAEDRQCENGQNQERGAKTAKKSDHKAKAGKEATATTITRERR